MSATSSGRDLIQAYALRSGGWRPTPSRPVRIHGIHAGGKTLDGHQWMKCLCGWSKAARRTKPALTWLAKKAREHVRAFRLLHGTRL